MTADSKRSPARLSDSLVVISRCRAHESDAEAGVVPCPVASSLTMQFASSRDCPTQGSGTSVAISPEDVWCHVRRNIIVSDSPAVEVVRLGTTMVKGSATYVRHLSYRCGMKARGRVECLATCS